MELCQDGDGRDMGQGLMVWGVRVYLGEDGALALCLDGDVLGISQGLEVRGIKVGVAYRLDIDSLDIRVRG